jgi:hypothetical protein
MDPIVLSTMTAALTVLGTEVGKATASEAGKTAWQGVLKLFGWTRAPALPELAESIANKLQADPELARRVLGHLGRDEVGPASTLVANISAEKVVVAQTIQGDVHM